MSLSKHRGHEFVKLFGNDNKSCDGCKLKLGNGDRYKCCNGRYLLHEDCYSALKEKNTIPVPFHPEAGHCVLKSLPDGRRCDGCEENIKGFVYHHEGQGWDFHPTCANKLIQHMEEITNEHRDHGFELVGQGPNPYTCDGCKELGMGDRYKCSNSESDYVLHKDCYSAFVEKKPITVPLHPKDGPCYFLEKSFLEDRHCDACHGKIEGFVYHHFGKGWDFHPTCANLERNMKLLHWEGGHLTITLKEKPSAKCYRCGKKNLDCYRCLKKEVCDSWCDVSNCGEYHFHVQCLKAMLLEALVETQTTGETSKAVASRPKLDIVAKKKKSNEFEILLEFAKIAGSILAALLGDPSEFSINLLISLMKALLKFKG